MIVGNSGFIKEDIRLYLNKMELLNNSIQLKKIHVDIYQENPFVYSNSFMLLLRTYEDNAIIMVDNDRIIFKRNDTNKTHFVNVLSSKITECFSKVSNDCYEFIFNIQNLYYKVTIFN